MSRHTVTFKPTMSDSLTLARVLNGFPAVAVSVGLFVGLYALDLGRGAPQLELATALAIILLAWCAYLYGLSPVSSGRKLRDFESITLAWDTDTVGMSGTGFSWNVAWDRVRNVRIAGGLVMIWVGRDLAWIPQPAFGDQMDEFTGAVPADLLDRSWKPIPAAPLQRGLLVAAPLIVTLIVVIPSLLGRPW